jgi:catechol 2,3-dioxygenase-like lactoylglutathione lyase family enzyme
MIVPAWRAVSIRMIGGLHNGWFTDRMDRESGIRMTDAMMVLISMVLVLAAAGCQPKQPPEESAPRERPESPVSMGTYAQIAVSVHDLAKSLPFYEKLGFKVIAREQRPYSAVTIGDGVIHVRLEQDSFPSPRLDYVYGSALDRDTHARQLRQLGIATTKREGLVEFVDPSGLHVGLVVRQLPDPPLNQSVAVAGYFNELAIPTSDRDKEVEFWKKLGYQAKLYETPYPWANMRDGAMILGVHQTEHFKKIAITYFAKNQAAMIAKLKRDGMTFTDEEKDAQGRVANATLTAPDGQVFFLYTGE